MSFQETLTVRCIGAGSIADRRNGASQARALASVKRRIYAVFRFAQVVKILDTTIDYFRWTQGAVCPKVGTDRGFIPSSVADGFASFSAPRSAISRTSARSSASLCSVCWNFAPEHPSTQARTVSKVVGPDVAAGGDMRIRAKLLHRGTVCKWPGAFDDDTGVEVLLEPRPYTPGPAGPTSA